MALGEQRLAHDDLSLPPRGSLGQTGQDIVGHVPGS